MADGDCSHEIKRHLLLGRKVMTNLDSIFKRRDITLPTKIRLVKASYGFSSSHVWMWKLDCEESWVLENWCFWTVVLEKTLESPMDCKEIQQVHSKGDQSWVFFGSSCGCCKIASVVSDSVRPHRRQPTRLPYPWDSPGKNTGVDCHFLLQFFGRNDAKAETPILWPPHVKSWPIGKDPDSGRDWGQKEKGMTEDEMAGWHHRLDGRESEWTPGVGDGQGGLACCNSWGHKELDTTERLALALRYCVSLLTKIFVHFLSLY